MDDNRFKVLNLFDRNSIVGSIEVRNCFTRESFASNKSKLYFSRASENISTAASSFEYVFVPGIDNPRWLVKNTKESINNLGFLVKPTSFLSKAIWKISIYANRFNLFGVFYKWRLYSDVFDFQDFLRQVLNDQLIEISAIYTGARSREAKFIIQISRDDIVKYYCKIGMTNSAINEVSSELEILSSLSSRLTTVKIPSLVASDSASFYGSSFFVTDNIIADEASVNLSLTNHDTLVMLDIISLENPRLVGVVEICKQLDMVDNSGLDLSRLNKLSSCHLTFVPAHGDYIPWNRVVFHGDLHLLDWERYGFYPLFFDHVYFIIHVCVLVSRETAEACHYRLTRHIGELIRSNDNLDVLMEGHTVDSYICASIVYIYRNYAVNESYNETCMLDFLGELFTISSLSLQ